MIREPAANGSEAGQRELEVAYRLTWLHYLYISDEKNKICLFYDFIVAEQRSCAPLWLRPEAFISLFDYLFSLFIQ